MNKLLLVFFLLSTLFSKAQYGVIITEVANMPMAISNNVVVEGFVNNTPYAYSFGGIDATKIWSGITKKSFRYNTITNIWDTIPDLPNTNAVIAAGASYVDSIIYIIGGYQVLSNGNEISSNIINRFDPRTNTYLSNGAPIPVAIDDHIQAVYKDSLIYIITGWSNTGNVPNVQIYDPANNNWLIGTPIPNSNSYKAFGASGIIIEDTIYYHGGASTAGSFPGQSGLRKGVINPANPTQITWTNQATNYKTYRAACTQLGSFPFWLGGSEITYNFNGIAYNGTGGVPTKSFNLYYDGNILDSTITTGGTLPMDLRGIANAGAYKYIAGGMLNGQIVSNKTYKIELGITTSVSKKISLTSNFNTYPNPASNQFNIVFDKSENRAIRLLDLLGHEVFNMENKNLTLQLDVSNYPKGVY
ncbi:MAG: T9SS type A sorting domain-containing protein, partial [Flavobacteriales bacterium]|nr:T9SS type A sorting domain-containing protein [Flavobacteriales bacterium]